MTKLNYPADGLHPICRGDLADCSDRLVSAASSCSFDVPSGFSYGGYLGGLGSTLNGYNRECISIGDKIRYIDKTFTELSDTLVANVNRLNITKVNGRERLIV